MPIEVIVSFIVGRRFPSDIICRACKRKSPTVPSSQYLQFVEFLVQHLSSMAYGSGHGEALKFPDFDLMSFDYLEFAEQELARDTAAAKINCVGHLKRAVECELDTLITVLGISQRAMNLPQKLEFSKDAGIISPRSLMKLNQMRNRMEHQYSLPNISELEVYFDLVTGFVHALEGSLFMIHCQRGMQWHTDDDPASLVLDVELFTDTPRVDFVIRENWVPRSISFSWSSRSEYCEGLKIYFLLCRAVGLVNREYVLSKLNGKPLLRGR